MGGGESSVDDRDDGTFSMGTRVGGCDKWYGYRNTYVSTYVFASQQSGIQGFRYHICCDWVGDGLWRVAQGYYFPMFGFIRPFQPFICCQYACKKIRGRKVQWLGGMHKLGEVLDAIEKSERSMREECLLFGVDSSAEFANRVARCLGEDLDCRDRSSWEWDAEVELWGHTDRGEGLWPKYDGILNGNQQFQKNQITQLRHWSMH